jgi:hypothetical protein
MSDRSASTASSPAGVLGAFDTPDVAYHVLADFVVKRLNSDY